MLELSNDTKLENIKTYVLLFEILLCMSDRNPSVEQELLLCVNIF